MRDHPLDATVFNNERLRGGIGKAFQFTGSFGLINQLAGNSLRAGNDKSRIRVPQATLNQTFFNKRKFFFDLGRLHQARARAKCLAGCHLALQLFHAGIVADAGDFDPANTGVMAHLLIEIDGIKRGPARQEVMAGRIAEVGCVCSRADIGGNAGFIDADNIVPTPFDQVMDDGCADDAAKPDDYDFRFLRKLCHFMRSHLYLTES